VSTARSALGFVSNALSTRTTRSAAQKTEQLNSGPASVRNHARLLLRELETTPRIRCPAACGSESPHSVECTIEVPKLNIRRETTTEQLTRSVEGLGANLTVSAQGSHAQGPRAFEHTRLRGTRRCRSYRRRSRVRLRQRRPRCSSRRTDPSTWSCPWFRLQRR